MLIRVKQNLSRLAIHITRGRNDAHHQNLPRCLPNDILEHHDSPSLIGSGGTSMYNMNLDNSGVAKVHRADSQIRSCRPRRKQIQNGQWLLNLATIPPNDSTYRHDGRNYTVEYCMSRGRGCMRYP